MKPDRSLGKPIIVRLGKREGELLERTLKQYPVLPSNHPRLTRKGDLPDQESSQELLQEALEEQRAENRKRVREFLGDPKRFGRHANGFRLEIPATEVEWLLQVLNDIRVGSWVLLGCPEHRRARLTISAGQLPLGDAQHYWSMEVSGYFQMRLLEKLHPEI